jgi:3'-5' exoribonuclease
MTKQFINELKEGQAVDSTFSVKYKKPPSNYKSKSGCWFTVGLSDMTGEMELKFWGGLDKGATTKRYSTFKEDDVIHVTGFARAVLDKGKLEIHVNEDSGRLDKTDDFNIEDFVPRTKQDIEKMLAEINSAIASIENRHIKALMESFFNDKAFVKEFSRSPSGITMHHNYVGGLLEHTLHVLHICRSLLEIYPQMDRDLLFAGAVLHDIGKTREFRTTTNIKQTEDGMLRGHITISQEMLLEKISGIAGFPDELKLKIAHILLSHHGNGEYGSPVIPAFAEAEAIHYADECDTKLDQHITTKEDPRTEDFRTYSRKLGRLVYLK